MADINDVRRIALALPDVVADGQTFRVNGHLVAWPWMQRIDPKKARVANPDVLVVRVASELDKQALMDLDPSSRSRMTVESPVSAQSCGRRAWMSSRNS